MPVNSVPLLEYPPKAKWLVAGMFPLGHVSIVYSAAGIGKTRLIAYLATQVTRPDGLFLGHVCTYGRVLILDADDPSGFGYQTWLNRFLAASYDADRSLIDLRAVTGGLTPDDFGNLKDEFKDDPPRVIVLDTFASAFIGLDTLKGHYVQVALTSLADVADELGCAVLVLDHVGKLQPGQTVVSKGPYGAAKTFSPRAVFALSRVPPKEVEGKDIIRLDCTKQSYAPEPAPIGIEITLERDDTVARVQQVDLPRESLFEDAQAAILVALKGAKGEPMPRQALLTAAVQSANCTERYAAKALKELLRAYGRRIREITLKGRGSPKGYMFIEDSSSKDEEPDGEGIPFDEQPFSSKEKKGEDGWGEV